MRIFIATLSVVFAFLDPLQTAEPLKLEQIRVSKDGKGFVLEPSGEKFTAWGFNYDHDSTGRLIEDYWDKEWESVKGDFAEMKTLGANVVRVHIQFGKIMSAAEKPNEKSLDKLGELLKLAESTGLYLDLTGLGCYHKADVPAWYDEPPETHRWAQHTASGPPSQASAGIALRYSATT